LLSRGRQSIFYKLFPIAVRLSRLGDMAVGAPAVPVSGRCIVGTRAGLSGVAAIDRVVVRRVCGGAVQVLSVCY
jgi:hypothetical protein